MLDIPSDCEWWVIASLASLFLFVISEVLPLLEHQQPGEDGQDIRVHGVVQLLTLIIRSRWGRHHPQVQECLRGVREIVNERPIDSPPSSRTRSAVSNSCKEEDITVEITEQNEHETKGKTD